jgi:hypothetical protein
MPSQKRAAFVFLRLAWAGIGLFDWSTRPIVAP